MSHRKLTRWMFLFTVVTALLLAAGCIQSPLSQAQQQSTPTPLPTLAAGVKTTYTVTRGSIQDVVKFDGRIVPVQQRQLFFKVAGRVRKIYAQENDTVKAGQVLADLNSLDDLESQQVSRQLNLRRAQIQVDIAQNDLDLFKLNTPRWETGYDQQMAIKTSQLELAKIGLQEASLGVTDLSKSISDASIIAPFDGQLLSFSLTEGQTVDAYTNVAVVADVTKLEVSSDVPAESLTKLSEGMPVAITSLTSPNGGYKGSIRRIPYLVGATTNNSSGTDNSTRITLDVPADQSGYKLNNSVQITVVLQKKDNVLLLPIQAIRTFEGRNFVLVKNGNLQQRQDIKIGITTDTFDEIVDGVIEGQVIIAP